jgi:hypothetical protein
MKKPAFILIFIIGTGILGIYAQTKNDDILKLLRITGSDKLADQVMEAMMPQFRQLAPGVPDAFWIRFNEKLNADDLLYACVPIYSKYYTHDEIKRLIAFYETPLGKKAVEVTPLLTRETMELGRAWGERLGRDIVGELIREGYVRN